MSGTGIGAIVGITREEMVCYSGSLPDNFVMRVASFAMMLTSLGLSAIDYCAKPKEYEDKSDFDEAREQRTANISVFAGSLVAVAFICFHN